MIIVDQRQALKYVVGIVASDLMLTTITMMPQGATWILSRRAEAARPLAS
jgi:hypothetical protein